MTSINIFPVLCFAAYFFLEALYVQLVHMLSDLKVKNKSTAFIAIFVLFLGFCYIGTAPGWKKFPETIRILGALGMMLGRLLVYIFIFRKLNLKIIYIYLLSASTTLLFYNVLEPFLINNFLRLGVMFLIEVVVLSSFMVYTKKKKKEEIYRHFIASLPGKVYALILILLLVASMFVMAALHPDNSGYIIKYVLVLSMIELVILTISIVRIGISEAANKSSVDLLSKQVENQIEYYEKVNRIYGEFRSFRHDYKNHVLCLRSLIVADKKAEALEYMETIQDMSSVDKNRFHTRNVIIDALLNDKSEKAEKSNTKLDFSGAVPTEGISNADLCIIMANAIDNAIEACGKDTSDEAKVIKIDADFKQGFFFFRAVNPVFEEVQFKGKNRVVTSKTDKDKHGFGVANIVRTAEKYGGTAEISADNGEFAIEVQLTLEQV